jgi:hypothetical protein
MLTALMAATEPNITPNELQKNCERLAADNSTERLQMMKTELTIERITTSPHSARSLPRSKTHWTLDGNASSSVNRRLTGSNGYV